MPYDSERASRIGHVPVARDPRIEEVINRWEIPAVQVESSEVSSRERPLDALTADSRDVVLAMAFDGSDMEIVARAEYPSVTVGFLQIGGSFINMPQFWASRVDQLVDPRALRASIDQSTVSAVLPGGMVRLPGMNAPDSWRTEVADMFNTRGFQDENGNLQSLTDALYLLHGTPGNPATHVIVGKCPACEDAPPSGIAVPPAGVKCAHCSSDIFPTDVLRSVEEFSEYSSNLSPMTRIMNAAERLFTISVVDWMFRNAKTEMGKIIVIQDGPLAFFGTTAPMKSRWVTYWTALTQNLSAAGLKVPLLCGIEKSGAFVDHAAAVAPFMKERHVLPLTNDYIQRMIRAQDPTKVYGKDEFYGRRFIYKSSTRQTLVVTIPRMAGVPYEAGPTTCEDPVQYPTLRPTLEFLDQVQTRLYPNAVVPVALAHTTASLPMGTGREVLTVLTKQSLGLN